MPEVQNLQSFMPIGGSEVPKSPSFTEYINLVTNFLRRQYLIVVICALLSMVIGVLFYFSAKPVYTASATMMIESRKDNVLQNSTAGDAPPDTGWMESQIEILKSKDVAAYVVKQLHLADDLAFIDSEAGRFDKLLGHLGLAPAAPKSDAERAAVATGVLTSHLRVQRIGPTYLIRIDFRSANPEQATKIANAMIDAYIFDQLNAKYQANRRAGDWLQERLQALREQAGAAERAVIEFKSKNNIVAASGTLMNEKQLGETSGQLATERAHVSDLQARLNRIEAIRKAYQPDQPANGADETISDALGSQIINQLRARYLEYVNREVEWERKYGRDHTAVVNLRNQIHDIRGSIYDELGRIEQSYRSEYEIAKKRQDELEQGLSALISQSTATNQAQVTLFSLEAAAKSYRTLYDDFLQRYTESTQQQSFPISNARAVSSASVAKTFPTPSVVFLTAALAGVMIGAGIGALRELMDDRFRTRDQVRSVLEAECLAVVPLLGGSKMRLPGELPDYSASDILWAAVESPSSAYAESIRSIKLGLDLKAASDIKSSRVIGITSCLAGEGKSSVAIGMASLMARSGARVILVDGDVRNPSLTRMVAPDARVGLLDVITAGVKFGDAVTHDAATKMAFMPIINRRFHSPTDLMSSNAAKALFSTLEMRGFEYVIVDLPPLISEVDIQATSGLIDSYILVIKWGDTKIDAVRYALRNAPDVRGRIVGAVLNKVDLAALQRYDSHGGKYYYGRDAESVTDVRTQ